MLQRKPKLCSSFPFSPTDFISSYLSAHPRLALGLPLLHLLLRLLLFLFRILAAGLFPLLSPESRRRPRFQSLATSSHDVSLRLLSLWPCPTQVSSASGGTSCSALLRSGPSALRGPSAALCRYAGRAFNV